MATTAPAFRLLASLSPLLLGLIVALGATTGANAQAWDKNAWLKKLEEAKKAEGNRMIQYDAQPNYANWGGVTLYFKKNYGVEPKA